MQSQEIEVSHPLYSLVVRRAQEDTLVVGVLSELEEHDITSPNDLIATPLSTLEDIFKDPNRRLFEPMPLVLARAIRVVALFNAEQPVR